MPWFFIVEALNSGCSSIRENSYLVKKIVFNVSLLPVVKLGSAVVVHCFFVLVFIALLLIYGYMPTLYWLQVFYYIFCMFSLLLAVAWITSSVAIFFPDLHQLISMGVQFGFWLTPVFWNIDNMAGGVAGFLRFSPFSYVVEGFRDSFIRGVWFWDRIDQTLVFWAVVIALMLTGLRIFKKLRPHFADVL